MRDERYLDIPQLMERQHLRSRQTAMKRMKEMRGWLDTRPRLVPISSVEEWERNQVPAMTTAQIRAIQRIQRQRR